MITLINDDCISALKELENNSIDCIITDPPYGIDQMNHKWDDDKIKNGIDTANGNVKGIPKGMKFDPNSAKQMGEFIYNVSCILIEKIKPGGFCIIFSQSRSSHRIGVAIEDAGFELRDQLIWDYGAGQGKAQGMQNFITKSKNIPDDEKQNLIKQMDGLKTPQLTPTFETMWLCQKPKEGTFVENWLKYKTGLVNFKNGSRRVSFSHKKPNKQERSDGMNHPTQKPVSLMVDLLNIFCPENGIVLDCFCGSGTTGVAAINNNYKFIGIDKSAKWIAVTQKRTNNLVFWQGEK